MYPAIIVLPGWLERRGGREKVGKEREKMWKGGSEGVRDRRARWYRVH